MRPLWMFSFALALAACRGAAPLANQPPRPPPAPYEVPRADPAPADPLSGQPLPGLDDLDLKGTEASLVRTVVGQLYAPCTEQAISILQCVEEARPCAACRPAARLLAGKIKEGATAEQAREMVTLRFGPKVKSLDVGASPVRGPATAPVTLTVWSDFQCPHCRAIMPLLDRLAEKFSPSVRLVHKFYPLQQHVHAAHAARAAIAAHQQGKYWDMEKTLFAHQDQLSDVDLERYAHDLGLNMKRFDADMTAERTAQMLKQDQDDAERFELSGTPFVVINGRVFDTAYFHLDADLEAWIKTEIELRSPTR